MNTLVTLHVSLDDAWAAASVTIVGALTPALVAIVERPVWQSQTKRIIAVASAVLLGILTVIGNGVFGDFEVTLPSLLTMVFAVVGASQTAYSLLWKPTGAADRIEESVNPGPPAIPPTTYQPGGMTGPAGM